VPASGGEFVLTHRPDPRPQRNPALDDFTPADQFDVCGTYVTERTTRDGIGAPVVAVGREVNKEARANFTTDRIYYGVTAIARFEDRRCVLSFEDPLAVETVRIYLCPRRSSSSTVRRSGGSSSFPRPFAAASS
jgi:hypothetical protein